MRHLLVLTAVAAVLGLPLPVARASCAGPQIGVEGLRPTATGQLLLRAGQQIDVVGSFYADAPRGDDGCHDTGPPPGDGGCDDGPQPNVPARHVPLYLDTGGTVVRLGFADADERFEVHWPGTLPASVQPGSAVLRTDRSSVRLLIVRAR